ncbi:MAG: hypothetical protein HC900_08950 [Methylacidiphilales bacterium]|nr:hypothetical protein [Candidatus Methylacidiphilales bacterium]
MEAIMSDFEEFTRQKIARLRAEADTLEQMLREYQAHARKSVSAAQIAPKSASRPSDLFVSPAETINPESKEPTRRGNSAFGAVMTALKSAGPGGMSLDEMEAAANAAGRPIKRPALRSQIWYEKNKGRVVEVGEGRYAVAIDSPAGHD